MESATRLEGDSNDSKEDESLEPKREGGCSLNSKNNSVANGYPDHRSRDSREVRFSTGRGKGVEAGGKRAFDENEGFLIPAK